MTGIAFNPDLPGETLEVLGRVEWESPIVLLDPHDPFRCETCHRKATLTVTFADGAAFEVCDMCRADAGSLVTVGPLLAAELVTA